MAAFDGWTDKVLDRASSKFGISYKKAKTLFPRGGIDLAKYYHQYSDQIFIENLKELDINNLSHSQKVEIALKLRFRTIESNKEAFMKSMALFALPIYQLEAINLVWATSDLIWREIKDNSLGFSWYTKRITLLSVYLSALLYFLGDDSINHEKTENFIVRRLEDISKIGRFKFNFEEFFNKLNMTSS